MFTITNALETRCSRYLSFASRMYINQESVMTMPSPPLELIRLKPVVVHTALSRHKFTKYIQSTAKRRINKNEPNMDCCLCKYVSPFSFFSSVRFLCSRFMHTPPIKRDPNTPAWHVIFFWDCGFLWFPYVLNVNRMTWPKCGKQISKTEMMTTMTGRGRQSEKEINS